MPMKSRRRRSPKISAAAVLVGIIAFSAIFAAIIISLPRTSTDDRSQASTGTTYSVPPSWYRAPGSDTAAEAIWYEEEHRIGLRATSFGAPFVFQPWNNNFVVTGEFRGYANENSENYWQEFGIQLSSGDQLLRVRTWADKNSQLQKVGWWRNGREELGQTILPPNTGNVWLRLSRSGEQYTAEYSLNGSDWQQVENGQKSDLAITGSHRDVGFFTYGGSGGEGWITNFALDVGSGFTLETYYDENQNGSRESNEKAVPATLHWKEGLRSYWHRYDTTTSLDGKGGRIGGLSLYDNITVLLDVPEGYNAPMVEQRFQVTDSSNRLVSFPLTKPIAPSPVVVSQPVQPVAVVAAASPKPVAKASPVPTPSPKSTPIAWQDYQVKPSSEGAMLSSPSPVPSIEPAPPVTQQSWLSRLAQWLSDLWCRLSPSC